jgi:hypothetical protein
MITNVLQTNTETEASRPQLSHLQETAETLQHDALLWARSKLPLRQQELGLEDLFQRHDFVNWFKYKLAEGAAHVIAANDQRVLAAYLFEESINPDASTEEYPSIDATVHLLVKVSTNSAALTAFIGSLDRALVATTLALSEALFAGRSHILNIIPVTEEDVENRRGYAALLSSIFAPPLKIWHRA